MHTVGTCMTDGARTGANAHCAHHSMMSESALGNGVAGRRSYADVLRSGSSLVRGKKGARINGFSLLLPNR